MRFKLAPRALSSQKKVSRCVILDPAQKNALGHIVLDEERVALRVLLTAFEDEVGGQLESREDIKRVGFRAREKTRAGVIPASSFEMANNLGHSRRFVDSDEGVEGLVQISHSKISSNTINYVAPRILVADVLCKVHAQRPSTGERDVSATDLRMGGIPVSEMLETWVLQVDTGSDGRGGGQRECANFNTRH